MSHVSVKLHYRTSSFAAKSLLSSWNPNHSVGGLGLQLAECIISDHNGGRRHISNRKTCGLCRRQTALSDIL